MFRFALLAVSMVPRLPKNVKWVAQNQRLKPLQLANCQTKEIKEKGKVSLRALLFLTVQKIEEEEEKEREKPNPNPSLH